MYEIKAIMAPELENESGGFYDLEDLPDQEHISMLLDVDIGPVSDDSSDIFYVNLITGKYRSEIRRYKSDRGNEGRYLYFKRFNGQTVINKINEIIDKCTAETWEKTAANLTTYFPYEFENYQQASE